MMFMCVAVLMMVLTQEVFAVVIAIGGPDNGVDVLTVGLAAGDEMSHSHGALMIEFDEEDRAVDPVIENSLIVRGANPGKVRFV